METQAIGNILRTLRKERNLSQAVAADELGISRSHLTNIEKGHDAAGREVLMAAAEFYKVSLDWLTQRAGAVSGENAKALNDREALMLGAFRILPEAEADHLLGMMLARTNKKEN